MLQKLTDVSTNINVSTAENGFIGANFYTEDDGSAYIRITIKDNNQVLDFNKTDMLPRLDLFCSDGSIFTNEPLDIVIPDKGVVQYKVSDNVIAHPGRMDAKLFLANKNDSIHVANFYFTITDSGMTGPIGKEVHVESLKKLVQEVMRQNSLGLLDDEFLSKVQTDLKSYVQDNDELFKGNKGDKGDKGEQGPKGDKGDVGPQGIQGPAGKDGINGVDGIDGKPGIDGKDGVDGLNGEKGEKGDPFTYDDFTPSQLETLKGPKGDEGEKGEVGDVGPQGPRGADGVIKFDNLTETQKADLRSGLNYDLVKNISDLREKMNAVEGSFFRLPVYTPKAFNVTNYPLENRIFTNGRGQFFANYDVSKNKLQNGNIYYVDYISGSDTNDGTTKTKAFKSIGYAIRKTRDNDTLVLCEGTHFRSGGLLFPKPSSKSINIIGENSNVNVVWADEPNWQKTSNTNNVYETTRSNVNNVVDIKNKQSLKKVNSINEVDITSYSWFTDNTKAYVNCGFTPDKLIAPILAGSSVQFNSLTTDLYIENVNFIGGNNALQIDLSQNNNLYLKNVSLSFGNYLYNGLTVTGGKNVIVQNCQAYNNGYDGFNYHVGKDQSLPLVTEINCVAYENGSDKGTAGFKSNNGTTTHDGITSIRVNGVYARNDGGNVADVNEGTKSWNIGCSAFESYQGKDFQTASGSHMWLDNCVAYGSDNSINSSDTNSVIYTRSGDYQNKLIIGQEIKY
ncbi:BppU family phage baseplate upper protein [Staphylococcus haemolyticus]|uniref:BppU family phage baseplate upper protein n=1 Tax=Staphylococcus haemolyticus TaxID=1283 RepID=UPI001F0A6E02|nr:BppU family phage baseplate upper protein [Staphylococcus haemolyticus]MCH4435436.1 BppU family phage baseplate upper protein [Staphylococcus haemolyticus]